MTDRHYTEAELDRLSRSSAMPSGLPLTGDDEHLKQCTLCREKLAVLKQFYEQFEWEKTQPVHPHVSELAEQGMTNVIRLIPFHPKVDPLALGAPNHVQVLAAQTLEEEKPSTILRGTFASEQKNLLVRVMENQNAQTYTLYLLSENSTFSRFALIGVGGNNGPRFVPANAQGVATMPSVPSVDWLTSTLAVLSPYKEIPLEEGLEVGSRQELGDVSVECENQGDGIALSIICQNTVRHVLVGFADGSSILKDSSLILLSVREAREARIIRLFT